MTAHRPREAPESEPRQRLRIDVGGAVQGVGFRPLVHRLATGLGLAGWAANTAGGLRIEVEGEAAAVAAFRLAIAAPPANARVSSLVVTPGWPIGETGFAIRASTDAGGGASILPDLDVCADCLAEMDDPGARRHRYPFLSCTQCGPRYSIVAALPYDRSRTAMAAFPLCPACQAEYDDPGDRRFHAETIACPACGPRLTARDPAGAALAEGEAALAAAAAALRGGAIVAVKGIGGFHLMADAGNAKTVRRLRYRKDREAKPLAVMFATLADIAAACAVSDAEAALLQSRAKPIVILRRLGGGLADAISPGLPTVGAMLPAAPLHHLLLAAAGRPLVATSGNRSGEPMAIDGTAAVRRLGAIADLILDHDRAILRPVDDSVARIVAGRPMLTRRGRGHAPAPVAGEAPWPQGILALGGHLKSAPALTLADGAAIAPPAGDLDGPESRDLFDRTAAELCRLHGVAPRLVVRDLHPDYHSSRAAGGFGVPVLPVQHHLAHVAAVIAEHRLEPPVLGVAWDGTGYGGDGTVWGGEFLLLDRAGWRRVAHLRQFRLPGGEAAVTEPRRSGLGLLHAAFGESALEMTGLAPVADFSAAERCVLAGMLERGVNAPLTSSAGRLFDAVAALLGLRQRSAYEGEAAMALEWAAGDAAAPAYPFVLEPGAGPGAPLVVDWAPALRAVLADLGASLPDAAIAARFHAGLAAAIAAVAARFGVRQVALGGGCFQNRRLAEAAIAALEQGGHRVFWPEMVPANDGGLAFGQAAWAARLMRQGEL